MASVRRSTEIKETSRGKHMDDRLNLGNSIYPTLNDQRGLMICGYEWGYSKEDQRREEQGIAHEFNPSAITTFANKSPAHGDRAFSWKYDNRILKWFELWGHPLSRDGLGSDFDKCIVQTNWCNSQGHKMRGNYFRKLTDKAQFENFLLHIEKLDPALIFFMGSSMIDILQTPNVLERFEGLLGKRASAPKKLQKTSLERSFKIGFQSFESCEVVSLPHPSGSLGLSDDYIALFKPEISELISAVKVAKGVS